MGVDTGHIHQTGSKVRQSFWYTKEKQICGYFCNFLGKTSDANITKLKSLTYTRESIFN